MTFITYITHQDFRNFLRKFNNFPYPGYKNKCAHNEPTEAYIFLIKNNYKLIKSKKHVLLSNKRVKLDIDKKCQ